MDRASAKHAIAQEIDGRRVGGAACLLLAAYRYAGRKRQIEERNIKHEEPRPNSFRHSEPLLLAKDAEIKNWFLSTVKNG